MTDDQDRIEGAAPPPRDENAMAEPTPEEAPTPPAARPAPLPPPAPQGPAQIPAHWLPQVPPPPRRRRSPMLTVLLIVGLVVLGFIILGMAGMFLGRGATEPSLSGHVGVVQIEGVIRDGGSGGLFSGPAGARGIMKHLREARRDDDVKAVVLLINSPGGSPAASHAIYEEIQRLREKKKVVCCMTDVAASGGYYVASACDKIVAQGSTLTGSIGVIFGNVGYYGLMKKLGLTDETITAGKYKDMGSPMRPMNSPAS